MEKLKEIKALKALMSEDTYFKGSVSMETFEEMVLNIQNDHPIFLNTPHDAEHNVSLIKKVEEVEATLVERDEDIQSLEQQVIKYSDSADKHLENYEKVAKRLVILTRIVKKVVDPETLPPELRIELKAVLGSIQLAEDERDFILAKYWDEFSCPAAAEKAEIEKRLILGGGL